MPNLTRPACTQLLETCRTLKRSTTALVTRLSAEEARVQTELIAARQMNQFVDIFEEYLLDKISQLDEADK